MRLFYHYKSAKKPTGWQRVWDSKSNVIVIYFQAARTQTYALRYLESRRRLCGKDQSLRTQYKAFEK